VRAAFIQYSDYRTTDSVELVEAGDMVIAYKTTAAEWTLQRDFTGESNVTFTITATGQVQYTSSNESGSGYTGTMKFKAATLSI
jgi:hypothetical protein